MAIIDLDFAEEFGLNLNQGAVYNVMRFCPTYCTPEVIDGEVYYFMSKNMLCDKLPQITKKPDTMYRYYKQLESAGLIKNKKSKGKDYVHIVAEHAKKWNSADYPKLGCLSENDPANSDVHPNELGCSSENTPKNSDVHPTYIRESIKGNIHKGKTVCVDSSNKSDSPVHAEVNREDSIPASSYSTASMNDFLAGGDSAYQNIYSRLRDYFIQVERPKSFTEQAKCLLDGKSFQRELEGWIRHNMHRQDFYCNPTKFLRGGKGNFYSWISQPFKPYHQDSPLRIKQRAESGSGRTATDAGVRLCNTTQNIIC